MISQPTKLKIFYSWQSDLSGNTNRKAIENCIDAAIVKINVEKDDIKLFLEEATRDEAGSPEIPTTILRKIYESDVFICDITTINSSETCRRKTPNPNVLIELGYAIAELGWERIIMVFNKKFGNFETELPFDLDKRRVTPFTVNDKNDNSGKGSLTVAIQVAIKVILEKNPQKPSERKLKSEHEIKREKDVENLKNLMSLPHIETFELFTEKLPSKFIDVISLPWWLFSRMFESNTCYIYHEELKNKINEFKCSWEKIMDSVHFYHSSGNYEDGYFITPISGWDQETYDKYEKLASDTKNLSKIYRDLNSFIRENYLEIDLDELSKKAGNNQYGDIEKHTVK